MKGMTRAWRLGILLLFSSVVSLGLFFVRVLVTHSNRYWFLNWNLFLAWLPFVFAVALQKWLKTRSWLSWQGIALTLLWFGFLPNSFYLISDIIHIHDTAEVSILYDGVMFMSFIWTGYILGYSSLFLVHTQLLKRVTRRYAHAWIGAVLLLCSFALYLGRALRWNTWDVLVNPAGLLFDVSDRLINPGAHPQTFTTTLLFFVLLGTSYISIWQLIKIARETDKT